ncbi:MmcQ/YjbR family DNA-binding protein [Herbiconiux gentiana]|uniref:MmcQ/YjbR family DNA-binding protein n=1 Tax=Herbiconiux gentiana TaxID=2970912 RepID=UPI0022B96354|nr:MmcQ/YjbR family DNA-binding protein [Herbiconiux gentiana]
MEHPRLFDPADTVVGRLRELCLLYPESAEVEAWGRPTFRAGKKLFAIAGASMHRASSVVFKPATDEHPALMELDDVFVPPYFGPAGWLAIDLGPRTDWTFVAELLDTSYRQVALKRQIAALDAATEAPLRTGAP